MSKFCKLYLFPSDTLCIHLHEPCLIRDVVLGILTVFTPEEKHPLFQLWAATTEPLAHFLGVNQWSKGGECERTRPWLAWKLWFQRTIKYLRKAHTIVKY